MTNPANRAQAIDHRANAERALSTIDASDDPRNLPAGLDGIGSALLALHDLLRERLPERVEPEGVKDESAPADDLPGEPVEPSDLRAGDRVAFAWVGWERITCTLVSDPNGPSLRSDTPDSNGYRPHVTSGDEWVSGVYDVRLIERAPREDESPDEERARHSDDANCEWAQYRKDYGVDPTVATHKAFHAGFKAAQKCAKDGGWSWPVDTAPDDDRDEALARVACSAFWGGQVMPSPDNESWLAVARAAREHIEAEGVKDA